MLCSLVHPCSARLILNANYKDNNSPSVLCPKCNEAVIDKLPMELLPSPFTQQKDLSSSIVVKPSCGMFFNSYAFGDDLHIGIYSSTSGDVFSYWTKGIETNNSGWDNSLVVYSFPDPDATDLHLSHFINNNQDNWSAHNYDSNSHNCFDFVVEFAKYSNLVDSDTSKVQFVETFVKERLKSALKYVSIFRFVRRDGLIVL